MAHHAILPSMVWPPGPCAGVWRAEFKGFSEISECFLDEKKLGAWFLFKRRGGWIGIADKPAPQN